MVKQATKGQKEIYTDNCSTIRDYGIASFVSTLVYLAGCQFFWGYSTWPVVGFLVAVAFQVISVLLMRSMASAKFDVKGNVADAGSDLNDPTASGEYFKDAIILSVICQVLALYSNYFFYLLLALPLAILWKFVTSIFLPWIQAPSSADPETDEKKLRKRERQQIKYQRR